MRSCLSSKPSTESGTGLLRRVNQSLFGYKATKVFTLEKIAYLSDRYLDSDFIYECARGKVTDQHPITNYKT